MSWPPMSLTQPNPKLKGGKQNMTRSSFYSYGQPQTGDATQNDTDNRRRADDHGGICEDCAATGYTVPGTPVDSPTGSVVLCAPCTKFYADLL